MSYKKLNADRPDEMDVTTAFSFEAAGSLEASPELADAVGMLIIKCIQHDAAVPHDAAVASVLLNCPSLAGIQTAAALKMVNETIEAMCKRGTITRLSCRAEGRDTVFYFPRDAVFTSTPVEAFVDGRPDAPAFDRPLSPGDDEARSALVNLIKQFRNPDVVVRALDEFCPRCGALRAGHRCTA